MRVYVFVVVHVGVVLVVGVLVYGVVHMGMVLVVVHMGVLGVVLL